MADTTPNKILYVEDEPDIQTIARIALETVGKFQVKMCSSGKEALAAVEEFAPDCILPDVMMPGMDGPSVLKALRQMPACAHIPAIIPWRVNSPAHSAAALPHFRALAVRPWCSLGLTTRSIQPRIQDGTA